METAIKEKWVVDPTHSEIHFKVRHLLVSNMTGSFTRFDASIYTTGDDFMTAEADCWIDASSVETGSEDRDKHIKGVDFFDVANHPQIAFQANTVENVDNDGSYELWGNLTIKNITRKIKLDVEFGGVIKDPWGNEKAVFTLNGKINRKDWELNWNMPLENGGLWVSDEIRLNAEIQLMRSV